MKIGASCCATREWIDVRWTESVFFLFCSPDRKKKRKTLAFVYRSWPWQRPEKEPLTKSRFHMGLASLAFLCSNLLCNFPINLYHFTMNFRFWHFRLKIFERFSKRSSIWQSWRLLIQRQNLRVAMCCSPAESSSWESRTSLTRLAHGRLPMPSQNFHVFR